MKIALAAIVLLALIHLLPFTGYLTDDTFIHLQFAKNLIAGRGFAFNAGEPTYGATSPLWVLFLSAAGSLIPGAAATPMDVEPIPALAVLAKLAGALCLVLAVFALARLGRLLGWPEGLSLLPGLLLALHAWSARWAISGMETPLAVLLVVLALWALARILILGGGAMPLGLILGLASLARPECWLLALLALIAVCLGSQEHRLRRLLATLGGLALAAGPWLLFAWSRFHRLLPNTSAAKAGGFGDLGLLASALKTSTVILLSSDALLIALAVGTLVLWGPRLVAEVPRGRRIFWVTAALWPIALVAGLAAGGVQVVSRYLLPATPALILVGIASARRWIASLAPRFRTRVWALLVLVYAGQNAYLTCGTNAPHARRHTPGLKHSLAALGLWARAKTPPGTVFAVPDIGAFGYYSDRPVLDLYGLVTPRMAPIMVHAGYDAVVMNLLFEQVGRPAYLIDRARTGGRLAETGDPSNPYRLLAERTIPDLGVTRPGEFVYSLYSIDWELYDRMHPRVARTDLDLGPRTRYAKCRLEAGDGVAGGRRQLSCAHALTFPVLTCLRGSSPPSASHF
jgi:hypothetical protein